MNLRHIWETAAVGRQTLWTTPDSDVTPLQMCTWQPACGSEDMVQNYMDYSDDGCINLFTQGQADRMNALFTGGTRISAGF